MFSLFRFAVTLSVTVSVVTAFFGAQHRWQDSLSRRGSGVTTILRRLNARASTPSSSSSSFSLASSSSSSETSSAAALPSQAINAGNSSAFLEFDGALNAAYRNFAFMPLEFIYELLIFGELG